MRPNPVIPCGASMRLRKPLAHDEMRAPNGFMSRQPVIAGGERNLRTTGNTYAAARRVPAARRAP